MQKIHKILIGFFFFLTLGISLFFNQKLFIKKSPVKPRLSIITSVYKGDEFIEGFLQDITQQTIFDQCELIMINANSPGHEERVIQEYLIKYPNIRYIKLSEDLGLAAVWNHGIKIALADFISNANLDDRSYLRALEIQLKEIEANPNIDLVYTGYLITQTPNDTYFNNHANACCDPPEFSIENMKYCLPGPRPIWRKSLHDRYGFFNEDFISALDYEMWLRAVSLGSLYKKVPGFYTLYYHNPKGLSTDQDAKKVEKRLLEGEKINKTYGHLFKPN